MTTDILTNVTISNFPSGMRYVFGHGQEKVKLKQIDPAGFDNQVNGLRTVPSVDDAVARFAAAYSTTLRAEQLAQGGRIREATDEWRKIFGDYLGSEQALFEIVR